MRTALIDVLGTFFSLEPLRQRLTALGAPDHTLDLWFSEAMRDFFALSLAGDYVPLEEILAASLPRTIALVGKGSTEASRHELVLKGLKVLNPVEGAAEACERLTRAGFRLVALTNGSAEHAQQLLDRAGLLKAFAAVVSADDARMARPHTGVYGAALAGAEGEAWMISAHAWDVVGARRAGLSTAWISKKERRWLSSFGAPDLEAIDLAACARGLEDRYAPSHLEVAAS